MHQNILIALALLSPCLAAAESTNEISLGIRPTLRRSYVFTGDSKEQMKISEMISGKEPESEALLNKTDEIARFELEFRQKLNGNLKLMLRLMGGHWQLRLTDGQEVQNGLDFNSEIGLLYKTEISNGFSLDSNLGIRIRSWRFSQEKIPKHSNIGLVIGLTPAYNDFSLKIENTLAAATLNKPNELGVQRDSSSLRVRPQYVWKFDWGALQFGMEYFHTHTEFSGTQFIPNQNSFMLDDLELAGILGITRTL